LSINLGNSVLREREKSSGMGGTGGNSKEANLSQFSRLLSHRNSIRSQKI